jgi:hypothetical protein
LTVPAVPPPMRLVNAPQAIVIIIAKARAKVTTFLFIFHLVFFENGLAQGLAAAFRP